MTSSKLQPQTLQQATKQFSNPDECISFVAEMRWPEGITCVHCQGKRISWLENDNRWKCKTKGCRKQFSVKKGTIMEDSPIELDKWLAAIWMITNCKNGISSYEIHRELGVTQKSAWFMLQRIRLAMQHGTIEKLSGHVEADETFVGGKAKNMHEKRRKEKIRGRGASGKAIVMGA